MKRFLSCIAALACLLTIPASAEEPRRPQGIERAWRGSFYAYACASTAVVEKALSQLRYHRLRDWHYIALNPEYGKHRDERQIIYQCVPGERWPVSPTGIAVRRHPLPAQADWMGTVWRLTLIEMESQGKPAYVLLRIFPSNPVQKDM